MKVNRLAKIASVFAEEGLGYLTGYDAIKVASGGEGIPQNGPGSDREKARRLKRIFERLGPTFVKFGQMLANRVDLFSDEFVQELSSLHANVTVFDHNIAMEIVESQLGRKTEEVFSVFAQTPVAAASIAQVYRATLRDSGEEVAVKVQRPGLDQSLVEDLELIVQMSSWLDALVPSYRKSMMHVVAKEYAVKSKSELDFLREASAIQEFGETYAEDPYFVFPKVWSELCGEKLIVMEWFEGPRLGQIKDAADLEARGFQGAELVRELFRLQLCMAYENGLIHADMHPGNLILLEDGRVGVIDCGLHARIPKKTREAVLNMLLYQSQGRIEDQVDTALRLSPPADPRDFPKFRQEMIGHYSKPQKKSATSVSVDIIATMRIGTKYRNQGNPYLLMIVRNFIILEGIFLKFDPSFDPVDHMGENVKAILMRRFSPQSLASTFTPVLGEIALALHNRPELLSKLLRLESRLIDSPTLGDFLRAERVIRDEAKQPSPWIIATVASGIGAVVVLILREWI